MRQKEFQKAAFRNSIPSNVELVVSTYNSPRSLGLCLISVGQQHSLPNSICIADDGSGPEVKAVIDNFAASCSVTVRHVWHEDRGFEKGEILNKAISSSTADFMIFIDGDVMIHPDFIRRHLQLSRRGRFSTGSLIRLSAAATNTVTPEMVCNLIVFDRKWLASGGALRGFSTWLKAAPLPLWLLDILERINPIRRSFCGANASVWRDDLLAVNGYDERIKYGGQDKELGERLKNNGVSGRHIRYSAPLVHLDHPRGYDRPEIRRRNLELLAETRAEKRTCTPHGIKPEQVAANKHAHDTKKAND